MLTHPDHLRDPIDHEDHEERDGGGWARLAAMFGSLPFRQLAGPAGVVLFWPVRPPARGQDGRAASPAHARRPA